MGTLGHRSLAEAARHKVVAEEGRASGRGSDHAAVDHVGCSRREEVLRTLAAGGKGNEMEVDLRKGSATGQLLHCTNVANCRKPPRQAGNGTHLLWRVGAMLALVVLVMRLLAVLLLPVLLLAILLLRWILPTLLGGVAVVALVAHCFAV